MKQEDKEYTTKEIKAILSELEIKPLDGMLDSKQSAQVWTKRAEIESGIQHQYDDNSVRWRVKKDKLKVARTVHSRLKLFAVEDIFAIDIYPQKGRKRA